MTRRRDIDTGTPERRYVSPLNPSLGYTEVWCEEWCLDRTVKEYTVLEHGPHALLRYIHIAPLAKARRVAREARARMRKEAGPRAMGKRFTAAELRRGNVEVFLVNPRDPDGACALVRGHRGMEHGYIVEAWAAWADSPPGGDLTVQRVDTLAQAYALARGFVQRMRAGGVR